MQRVLNTAAQMLVAAVSLSFIGTGVAETRPRPPTGGQVFAPPALPAEVEAAARFPALPPDPYPPTCVLPPLVEELARHGGAHLYAPEGDVAYEHATAGFGHELAGPLSCDLPPHHERPLRLPENFCPPQPFTWFSDFYGADPVLLWPGRKWFGPSGYQWEPRFVAAGLYELFGFAFEEGNRQQNAVGHQLLVDLDLQVTGTERIHAQWRPLGEKNTGGSYYQFSDPSGYVNNSTGEPDRIWFEGEVASVFSDWLDPFAPRDYVVAAGLLPFQLQNFLLMNDDVAGVVVSKNTIYVADLSNVNAQFFYFFDEVDAFPNAGAKVVGTNISIDRKHTFYELTYAFQSHGQDAGRDAHYVAGAATKLYGRYTLTGRAMFKVGDESGTGDGQLYVLESNHTRIFTGGLATQVGVHHGVFYANAFRATKGWRPISGGNFDRLRSSFQVNPLVNIARGLLDDTTGVAGGVQLFRHHEDESLTPEFAYESTRGNSVWGVGLSYQRKVTARSFWDVNGVLNFSRDSTLRRKGAFVCRSWLF